MEQELPKPLLPSFANLTNPKDDITTEMIGHTKYPDRIPYCINWAPNAKRVLVGNSKGELSWVDVSNFRLDKKPELSAQAQGIKCITMAKDESFYVTGDTEGVLRIFNIHIKMMREIKTSEQKFPIREISMAPTNLKYVTAMEDKTLKIWDVTRGVLDKSLEGHGNEVMCCDWHPQKGLIVSGSKDNTIKFWDPNQGTELATLNNHNNSLKKVKWNMNGNWLLSSSKDQSIKLYDLRMFKEIQAFIGLKTEAELIAWHPVHERLFASGDKQGTMAFWLALEKDAIAQVNQAHYVQKKDREGGDFKSQIVGSKINDLMWSPTGNMIASCGQDKYVKLWGRMKIEELKVEAINNDIVNLSSVTTKGENTFPVMSNFDMNFSNQIANLQNTNNNHALDHQ